LNRLESRVRKLEAIRGTDPFEEFDDHGLKALLIALEAQMEVAERGGVVEITEAALAKQRMTLPEFDEASASLRLHSGPALRRIWSGSGERCRRL
jgi:hypothetical protein